MDIPELTFLNAPEDIAFRVEIEKQLKQLVRNKFLVITPTHLASEIVDTQGIPKEYLSAAIKRSKIILMLWSADFLNYDTLTTLAEYAAMLDEQRMHNAVPILVRNCLCDYTDVLKRLKRIPRNGGSIEEQENKSIAYVEIAERISTLLTNINIQEENLRLRTELIEAAKKIAYYEQKLSNK